MSEPIRIELTGANANAWNRVFDTVTKVVEEAASTLLACQPNELRAKASNLAMEFAALSKDWVRAKLEAPVLDNELKLADIAKKLEEIRLTQAQREIVEVE